MHVNQIYIKYFKDRGMWCKTDKILKRTLKKTLKKSFKTLQRSCKEM